MTIVRTAVTAALLGGLVWMTDFATLVGSLREANVFWLVVATALVPLNIGLEIWKWRNLLGTRSRQGTLDAAGSLLAGYALGLFSPARAGEYVGRTLYLRGHGYRTALQTGVDRMYSMVIYVGAGLTGLATALWVGIIQLTPVWEYLALVGFVAGCALAFLSLRPDSLYQLLTHFSGSRKWVYGIGFLRRVGDRSSRSLLVLSGARYAVFSTQLVVLVLAFGGAASVTLLYVCVSLIFFVKTMVPAFTMADLGIRETAAVFFLGLIGIGSAPALNASLTLFLLNLVLPAVAGTAFVPRLGIPLKLQNPLNSHSGSIAQ